MEKGEIVRLKRLTDAALAAVAVSPNGNYHLSFCVALGKLIS